jgi:hypothetical protein
MNHISQRILSTLLLPVAVAACSDASTSPGSSTSKQVTVNFSTVALASGAVSRDLSRSVARDVSSAGAADSLVIAGTNGTLVINDVHFVVSKFELKRADVDCDSVAHEDDCERFRAAPSFLALPLNGGTVTAVSQEVPVGSYRKLKFEVKDFEVDDDGDAEEAQQTQSLLATVRQAYPDWPEKASMVVAGSYTPAGDSTAVPFRAYFKAEINIEKEFNPPLEIAATDASRSLSVVIDPTAWFKRGDGSVVDLSAYDYQHTSQLVEFEVEMEHGFGDVHDED